MEGVSLRLINKIKHKHERKYLRLPLLLVAVINGKQLQKKKKNNKEEKK